MGLVTAPETSTHMLASIKIINPRNQASKPADFLVLTNPFPTTQLIKPFIPPEYWVKVMIAPTKPLKRMTRVLSSSLNTSTRAPSVSMRPETGFQEWMMVHPSQIPRTSEM
ncbi:hypothetical protein ES703_118803 [subsurface metagenome]